jgi:Transglutaminase-like superfamily
MMPPTNGSGQRMLFSSSELFYALGPALGIGVFLLTPKAYWDRLRKGHSPLAPTLYERRRTLPKASFEGRVLSQEPYLRPTAYCDAHAPEVITLANGFRQRFKGDWEYAQGIYDFVRNEIAYALEPTSGRRVVGTLQAGCGVCLDKHNVFVALARAGGLPARYCTAANVAPLELGKDRPRLELVNRHLTALEDGKHWYMRTMATNLRRVVNQVEQKFATGQSFEMRKHPMVELKIGNAWIPADITWGDAEAAGQGLPLPRFGYDPLILRRMRATIVSRSEEAPVGWSYWFIRGFLCILARGLVDHLNRTIDEIRSQGQKVLTEIGEDEYIRRNRRFYVPVPGAAEQGLSLLV